VSTTTAPSPRAPSRLTFVSSARSLPSRAITFFSGPVGLAVKIALLAISNGLAVWAFTVLASRHNWIAAGAVGVVTLVVDVVYLSPRRFVPAKFLLPGTLLLLAFQLIPIFYTVNVAFSRYATGHILTKGQAITTIQTDSVSESGAGYTMAPARDASGKLVLVLVDQANKPYLGTPKGLRPLPRRAVKLASDGSVVSAPGYKLIAGKQLGALDLTSYKVPVGHGASIQPQGLDSAAVLSPTLRYDRRTDGFTRIATGTTYRDNGRGSFVSATGDELEPGWRTHVGLRNFGSILHNPLVRRPFIRVLIWTIAFATLTVLISFAIGLFLAIALDKRGMRFQRTYRTILVVPYAIPAFLSLLVWQGLLNDEFGVINRLFHIHVPWLFDPTWARLSVILVSVWLTVPYFFLVSMGALQSIPSELYEAARVDGGTARQVFRRVTLPLLLVVVAPLLIASFAFNFNNFNNIYLLTSGGPPMSNSPVAGSTDILISYTWKLALQAGKGNDYGLASAISIIIFFIVALISVVTFSRTKALENVQ
jgi:ABC-type sugar transport system permease subunit